MGKTGSVLAVFALILAGTAIGLQAYNLLVASPDDPDEKERSWYKHEPDYFRANPINTDIPFDDLTLSFNVSSGQSLYFLYTGRSQLDLDYDGFTILNIYFLIDGIRISEPRIRQRFWYKYSEIGGTSFLNSVSFQYVNNTLSPGTHNVTIVLNGNFQFNGVHDSSILVQTLNL